MGVVMGAVRDLLSLQTVMSPTTNISFLIDKAHFTFENIFLCKPFGVGAYYPPCESEMDQFKWPPFFNFTVNALV
jgi:hypothetical protein